MTERLTRENFARCLNTTFWVVDDPAVPIGLQLTEVQTPNHAELQETFSLVFRGPRDRLMPRRLHRVKHERLGESHLFLVPVGKDSRGVYYEAEFNRLVQL